MSLRVSKHTLRRLSDTEHCPREHQDCCGAQRNTKALYVRPEVSPKLNVGLNVGDEVGEGDQEEEVECHLDD